MFHPLFHAIGNCSQQRRLDYKAPFSFFSAGSDHSRQDNKKSLRLDLEKQPS
jgi:hypothetical protein